jgi:glycosyltransferase involved in cell wall biosynthesis
MRRETTQGYHETSRVATRIRRSVPKGSGKGFWRAVGRVPLPKQGACCLTGGSLDLAAASPCGLGRNLTPNGQPRSMIESRKVPDSASGSERSVANTFSPPAPNTTAGATPALPRILHVLTLAPGKKFGSMEEQIVLLGQAIAAQGGHFVPLFNCLPHEADVRQYTSHGLQAECLNLNVWRPGTLWQLRGLVRKHGASVVHWNFTDPLCNPYVWGLTLLAPAVRHWYTDHVSRVGGPPPAPWGLKRQIKRALLRRYSRVFCVSRFVQHQLEQQHVWRNLVSVTHFVNTARFVPDPAVRKSVRQQHHVDSRFVLVAVGQLIAEKGMDVAIRALPLLPPEVILWIVGEGPQFQTLQQLAEDLHVADRVTLLGLQRDVGPFLQAADAFVCPSRWCEAAGLVNLEAQACGVPLLGSRIGGIPEYVDEGRSGWLFKPECAEELAELVRQLLADPERRRRAGEAARQVALERFSPEARLPELLSLYRDA